jgi:hypothetical protein
MFKKGTLITFKGDASYIAKAGAVAKLTKDYYFSDIYVEVTFIDSLGSEQIDGLYEPSLFNFDHIPEKRVVYFSDGLKVTELNVVNCEINVSVIEYAKSVAKMVTELECKLNDIECYKKIYSVVEGDEPLFTDEAQNIFNIYYDEQYNKLNSLVDSVKKMDK